MSTAAELVDLVSDVIQDSSYTDATILSYINRGIRQIAGGLFIQYPDSTQVFSRPLPNLLTSGDLTTSLTLPYVDLPDDFGRGLIAASSAATGTLVNIMNSFAEFLQYYPGLDIASNVNAISVRGTRLYYQGIPSSADTITIHYYSTPDALVEDADIPTCIPTHLHEELLVNYASFKIFGLIEDGVEGAKVNSEHYKALFNFAMLDLESSNFDVPLPVVFTPGM